MSLHYLAHRAVSGDPSFDSTGRHTAHFMRVVGIGLVAALALPAQALAACSYGGNLGPYISCLATEIETLQTDVVALQAELLETQEDVTYSASDLQSQIDVLPQQEGSAVTIRMAEFGTDADGVVDYISPDGLDDSVDTNGMADGEIRVGAAGLVAVKNGANGANSTVYLNLGDSTDIWSCTLLHRDDDHPRAGLMFSTDHNKDSDIWGIGQDTFEFQRDGVSDAVLEDWEEYKIICF